MYKITVIALVLYTFLAAISVIGSATQLLNYAHIGAGPFQLIGAMGYPVAWFFLSLSMMYFVPLLLKRYVPEVKEA
ncbi:hypothetical protein [Pontivivens nitratireducens]|nr:hypothetical protein [Pontibrevibacter nitratireducens]